MRKTFTGFVAGLISGAILATGVTTWAVDQQVRLFVDGQEISFPDAPPQIINGRTMVPARPLAESLGGQVAWDAETSSVVITKATAPSMPESLKPFIIKIRRGDQVHPGSAIYDEGQELCIALRTIGAVEEQDVLLIDTTVKIGDVQFDRSELIRVDNDLYVRLSLAQTRLNWQATWDAALNTLLVQ